MRWMTLRVLLVLSLLMSGAAGCGGADETDPGNVEEDVLEDVGVDTEAVDTAGPDTKWQGKCIQGPGFCDDNNPCTEDDCSALTGCVNTPKNCADDDPCTVDSCDITNGDCKYVKDTCEDGNACTKGSCEAGQGCLFVGVDCSDGDKCTSDGCSPVKGCLNNALDCDDGVTCSVDSCDPAQGCVHKKPDGEKCCESPTDCEDGNVCTAHTCEKGVCKTDAVLGCCDADADCDDGNPCTVDTCAKVTGQCANTFQQGPGCCQLDADCEDNDKCTNDACVKGQCGYEVTCCAAAADCDKPMPVGLCGASTCTDSGCAVTTSADAACCKPELAETGFEESGGWSYTLIGAKRGVWKVKTTGLSTANKTSYAGAGAATFQATQSDLPGGQAVARLGFDEVELPTGRPVTLSFHFRAYLIGGTQGDLFRVRAETAVGSWYVWQAKGTSSNFQKVSVDLRGFASRASTRKVRLVFEMKPNNIGSTYSRVWLDAITLTASCTGDNSCKVDADCDDGLGSTTETCSAEGICVYKTAEAYCEALAGCNDKNSCTKDSCNNFACDNVPIPNCCTKSTQCADDNPCTTDYCSGLKCKYITKPGSVCCYQTKDCDDGNPCTIDQCPAVGLACAYTQTSASCCVADGDCDDNDKCTLDLCESNTCQHKNQCCTTDKDCDDKDDLCTKDTCDAMGMCLWTPTNAAGCCEEEVLKRDFEDGKLDGLVLINSATDAKWQLVSGKKAKSGKSALYYGNLTTNNYESKSPAGGNVSNKGTVIIKSQALPSSEKTIFSFDLWMQTEQGTSYDKLDVYVATGNQTVKVWDKLQKGFALGAWQTWKIDLSAWAGKTVDIRIQFDTVDSAANQYEGVYLDNLLLQRACEKLKCNAAKDCDDGLPASKDACVGGQCVYDF